MSFFFNYTYSCIIFYSKKITVLLLNNTNTTNMPLIGEYYCLELHFSLYHKNKLRTCSHFHFRSSTLYVCFGQLRQQRESASRTHTEKVVRTLRLTVKKKHTHNNSNNNNSQAGKQTLTGRTVHVFSYLFGSQP